MAFLIAGLVVPLTVVDSEAVLWDLIIDAEVVGKVEYGGDIIITGWVSNHAGRSEQSTVQIIIGSHVIERHTTLEGVFTVGIKDSELLPGMHVMYVRATTQDGLTGVLNTKFIVEGEYTPSEHTARMLSSRQALYYLNTNSTDFVDNSIDAKLHNYYHGLQQQMIRQYELESEIVKGQSELNVIKDAANKVLEESIIKDIIDNDVLVNQEHQIFLENLDDYERDIFIGQLNHTLGVHESLTATQLDVGQSVRQAIQERNSQYAIPRHVMESLTPSAKFDIEEFLKENGITERVDPEPVETTDESVEPTTDVNAGTGITTVYMNIDGVMTKHIYNGTSLVRAK